MFWLRKETGVEGWKNEKSLYAKRIRGIGDSPVYGSVCTFTKELTWYWQTKLQ